METDLRNPRLHPIFGYDASPGLSNALLGPVADFSDLAIRQTMVPNLNFLAAGDKPPNPSELLCSDKMDRVFALLREHYDFVLFDSPPVFLTSDPIILAQRVDGVVLVARSEETKKEILRETVERLLRVEAKIFGLLFNDISPQRKKYYYHKYRYYYSDEKRRKKKEEEEREKRYEEIQVEEMKIEDFPRGEEDEKEVSQKKTGGIKMGEMNIEDLPRGEEHEEDAKASLEKEPEEVRIAEIRIADDPPDAGGGQEKNTVGKRPGGIKMGEMKLENLPQREKNDYEATSWDVNSWEIKEERFKSETVNTGGTPHQEIKNGFLSNGKLKNGDKRRQIVFPPVGKGKNK